MMSEIKWLMVFWMGIHDSTLVCSGIKEQWMMRTEQSIIGVDEIPTYYATFIVFFINKYENLFLKILILLKMIAFPLP